MAPHAHVHAPRNTIETYSARPEREAPRNENGDIICTHEACRDKTEIFRRTCEWNKHMDKHERPYKCNEPTCELNSGFTYSGGLLRHMREVHKKGIGPTRKPLYCPHANCIRNTGEGFTRRENLEEHLRRRHSYTGHCSSPHRSTSDQNEENGDQPRKRRRTNDPESPNGVQNHQQSQMQLDPKADFLRTGLPPIDERLFAEGELDVVEANRQLVLARQMIAQQQEAIRQRDEELAYYRATQGLSTTDTFIARSNEEPLSAHVAAALPLVAQLQQETHLYPDPNPQDPQLNGKAQVGSQSDLHDQDFQQRNDKDAQANVSEPSRPIDITRDLISMKLTSNAL